MNGVSEIQKRYLAIANYYEKVSKLPKTSIALINEGISKENRTPYQIVDDKNRQTIDGTFAVGTILTGKMTMTVSEVAPSAPAPQAAKLNLNTK